MNLDYFYTVEHFVRPKETLQALKREIFCGGKGLNQSVAIAKAGAEIYHAGKIGGDGRILLETLEAVGVDTRYILIDKNEPTGSAIVQVDSSG